MQEKIYFKNSKGLKLCGILSNPTTNTNTPIIILCHGFTTSKNNFTNIQLERILNQNSIATFRFDFFGHGESEGDFKDITVSEAVDDILNAIGYIKNLGYPKIGLVGSSFGGIASIMAASKTNELYVLALKSPVSNYKERDLITKGENLINKWKEDGFIYHKPGKKLNYTFFKDYDNNNGYEAAKKIQIPTIIVHGDKDDTVPVEQSKKIATLIQKSTLEIIQNADHDYTPKQMQKVLDLISSFIIKNT